MLDMRDIKEELTFLLVLLDKYHKVKLDVKQGIEESVSSLATKSNQIRSAVLRKY